MRLLVGLGNPGPAYARHRHNVGFMAAETVGLRHRFPAWRRKFQALVSEGRIGDERVMLLLPQTYMNESGRAVGEAMRFLKLSPDDLIVLHDELDLAPGRLRVKTGGGVAGHNGLRSLAAHLGGPDFKRVRIGIGHPGHKDRVTGYVLGDFHKADRPWLEAMLDAIAIAAPLLVAGDDAGFMNRVALEMQPVQKGGQAGV